MTMANQMDSWGGWEGNDNMMMEMEMAMAMVTMAMAAVMAMVMVCGDNHGDGYLSNGLNEFFNLVDGMLCIFIMQNQMITAFKFIELFLFTRHIIKELSRQLRICTFVGTSVD